MKLPYTLLFFFLANILFSQNLIWKEILSGQKKEIILDIHVDNSNNIYTTGYFTENLVSQNQMIESNGVYDIFIQKMNSDGELIWLKRFGNMSIDEGVSITTDKDENVFISGTFNFELELDNNTVLFSAGFSDIFLMKLNSEGNLLWGNRIGGPKQDVILSIAVDTSGNLYCSGIFSETADFDPSNNDFLMTSSGNSMFPTSTDSFVAKYDSNGNFIWAKQYDDESPSSDPTKIIVTDSEEVLIIGHFSGVVDLDPSTGVEFFFSNSSNTLDGYILKLNTDGDFKSAVQLKASLGDRVNLRDIKSDSENNIYMIGSFTGSVDFDPGGNEILKNSAGQDDVFILKLNSTGSFVWVNQFKNNGEFIGLELALDQEDNIYSVGYFKGVSDFNPNPNPTPSADFILSPSSNNGYGGYLSILKNDGTFLNAYEYGGVGFWFYHGIALNNNDEVILAGVFENQVDLNPAPDSTNLETALNQEDSFIIKFENPLLVTSLKTLNDINKTKIYPNPINQFLTIESFSSNQIFNIYDLLGRKVKSGILKSKNSTIDCYEMNKGIYILEINNREVFKIIKK